MTTPQTRLLELKSSPIAPLSKVALKAALADLREIAETEPTVGELLKAKGAPLDFIASAFTLSPFLRDTAATHPSILANALTGDPATMFDDLSARARDAWKDGDEPAAESKVMATLRRIKCEAAFALALFDLARIFDACTVTARLSALAEACICAAVDHVLAAGEASGKLALKDTSNPSLGSGLIVLGMGKLGAGELNYSSDIDLVIFFEPDAGIAKDPVEAVETFSRLARRLVRVLQERTADGYVFRTDLRLRPDPGSTPLVIPVDAAMNYYEGRGQNWERAAFIKAKPVAGDMEAGQALMRDLAPFVFRKYLDYAAIADIHSIKRQIHVHKGHGQIAVKGHNVKLGRGGIREIEFFVQTQQLIAGGRMPHLRGRRTDETLAGLEKANWISAKTVADLTEAYWYLRDIEHRIQMVRDEQNHTLPEGESELKRIALMAGEKSTDAFATALTKRLKIVERYYARLFEQESGLSGQAGNLVFTGKTDDPDTLKSLAALGFERPADIAHIIRVWHAGRYRSTQSSDARERLTELTPSLLETFGKTRRADEAFLRFDSFISGLPRGIQLFSLLGNNPALLSLVVTIMAAAPRLSDIIAHKPHVFDGMLDPTLLAELPTREHIEARFETFLHGVTVYEEVLDRLRIVAAEQKFLIGVRLLTGSITGPRAGRALSDLADLVLARALDAVSAELERAHGKVPGGRVAIVGMGKLGSHEMTAGSDIDLILLYDHEEGFVESDGARPLDPPRYYARFTQRLIAALSAPTAEGILYEVDLRLRPSGNKGPVATSINAFRKYQAEEAWTWEHMALTRARVVAGDDKLAAEAEAVFDDVRDRSRDPETIAADVDEMRTLIEDEKPAKGIWDLKLVPGGLIDLEFIAQYLMLTRDHDDCEAETSTARILAELAPAALGKDAAETLVGAHALYTEVSQLVRLCIEGEFDPKDAPAGLADLLCRATESPDIEHLKAKLKIAGQDVRKIFHDMVRSGANGQTKKAVRV